MHTVHPHLRVCMFVRVAVAYLDSCEQTAACAAGKYKSAADKGHCTDCPRNSTSPAGSANLTNCTCNAGFPGPAGGPCTACVAGKYMEVDCAQNANLARSCGPNRYEACPTSQVVCEREKEKVSERERERERRERER